MWRFKRTWQRSEAKLKGFKKKNENKVVSGKNMEKEEPSYHKYHGKLYKRVVMYVGGSREAYKKGRKIC